MAGVFIATLCICSSLLVAFRALNRNYRLRPISKHSNRLTLDEVHYKEIECEISSSSLGRNAT